MESVVVGDTSLSFAVIAPSSSLRIPAINHYLVMKDLFERNIWRGTVCKWPSGYICPELPPNPPRFEHWSCSVMNMKLVIFHKTTI